MFKLESYLTPWLFGYLDKYVKLKPEDFQLSLWGGDAVFNKLDLRLNVIENLTNIPITFKSGVIHELRIHIPWTRITSEPVVVTINTLEFVAKLKDNSSQQQQNSTSRSSKSDLKSNLEGAAMPNPNLGSQAAVPAGYIQNIITKILFNICIIINNVVVKFVEDDMVLSVNMKSAECFSVNHLWEKTYVDIGNLASQVQQQSPEVNDNNREGEYHVRKVLQLNDVTICLDKLDKTTNKINFYQDPLIYRCSIQSRLDFKFNYSNLNLNNIDQQLKLIKLNFYCRKFDMSVTDTQLPMLIRLLELISAISDQSLVLRDADSFESSQEEETLDPSSQAKPNEIVKEPESSPQVPNQMLVLDMENEMTNSVLVDGKPQDQEGWLSWAWSYVPSVSNLMPNLEDPDNQQQTSQEANSIQTVIGFYLDEINIGFKLTQGSSHSSRSLPLSFELFMLLKLSGNAIEVNIKENYSHVLVGVSHINLRSANKCCCNLCPKPNEKEIVLLRAGTEYLEDKTFHYMTGSLFDLIDENLGSQADVSQTNPRSRDKQGNIDEAYGSQRFGALIIDSLNTSIDITKLNKNEHSQTTTDPDMDLNIELDSAQPELSSAIIILYGLEVNFSANLLHRALKVYQCSQAHSYTTPYSSSILGPLIFNPNSISAYLSNLWAQLESNLNDEANAQLKLERIARKLEKYIPLKNVSITLKEPCVRLYPYSHFIISSIACQESRFECYLNLDAKYLQLNITTPIDRKLLFDVVSRLTNPSKKLLYDSYIHTHITADSVKLNMVVVNSTREFKHESTILEPLFFELHVSNVIMSPDLWNKQYFPISEIAFELPILKINIHKQLLFILVDYLDHYLSSVVSELSTKPKVNKYHMKKAKLRQITYDRLLEDFLSDSISKKSEVLRFGINDFKGKHSLTKIMRLIEMNWNMCNIYMIKNDDTENLLTLLETSNRISGKNGNIKDFLVVRAQLPLDIDPESSYIPDPLFIYANVSESKIQVTDEFLKWLSYKPARGNYDNLNLLVLDLIEDSNTSGLENHTTKSVYSVKSRRSSQYSNERRQTKSSQVSRSLTFQPAEHPTSTCVKQTHVDQHTASNSTSKPTIFDTYYDLLKSINLQVSVKPVKIDFKLSTATSFAVNLPQIDLKSSGTKCDLEEELVTGTKLVEMPCAFLRACEKTSNKLPWIIDFKELNAVFGDEKSTQHEYLLGNVDINVMFTVKPKYNQYDNLLSSLSIFLNTQFVKKCDIHVRRSQLEFIVMLASRLAAAITNFNYRIDYSEIEKIDPTSKGTNHEKEDSRTNDWDETRSYSSISVIKEHDFNSLDEDSAGEEMENKSYRKKRISESYDEAEVIEEYSLSTGELSSSSMSSTEPRLKPFQSKKVKSSRTLHSTIGLISPVVYTILREKSEDQVKLNFTMQASLNHLELNLINDSNEKLTLSIGKLISALDINNIYQKFHFKIQEVNILQEAKFQRSNLERIIFTSNQNLINKKLYLNRNKTENSSQLTNNRGFIDLTFTRALISNFNKRYDEITNKEEERKQHQSKTASYYYNKETIEPRRNQLKLLKSSLKSSSSQDKYISELNISVSDFDILYHTSKISTIMEFYLDIQKNVNTYNDQMSHEATSSIPILTPSQVPLLNIDLGKIRFMVENENKNELLITQILSTNLTSCVEYPIIRSFTSDSSSISSQLYNKYRANGLLYRPGFAYEDRQYSLEIKSIAVFAANFKSLDENQSNETELVTTTLLKSFDLKAILGLPLLFNLNRRRLLTNGYVLEAVIPNLEFYFGTNGLNLLIDTVDENLKAQQIILSKYLNLESKVKSTTKSMNVELVPVDFLLTSENINVFFFKETASNTTPLLHFELTQPHICLQLHQNLQKFEILVFDLNVKRSTMASTDIINKSNFTTQVVETKPSEPDPKTGILSGFFAFRVFNFASPVLVNDQDKEKLEIVCNECQRCYLVSDHQNSISPLRTQFLFERPVRIKASGKLYKQVLEFLDSLKLPSTPKLESTESEDIDKQANSFNQVMTKLHSMNIKLSTSQIVVIFELESNSTTNSVCLSLNGLCLNLHNFNFSSNINHLDFKLSDFQCKLEMVDEQNKINCVHFIGPITLKFYLNYSESENQVYALADLGSFNVSFNKRIFMVLQELMLFIDQHLQPKLSSSSSVIKTSQTDNFNQFISVSKHDDNLRSDRLSYTIVDDILIGKILASSQSQSQNLANIRLPQHVNEIVCVEATQADLVNYVCWRYEKPRALTHVKILPLPFMSADMLPATDSNRSFTGYLEYLNECTKCFQTLAEFEIVEETETLVVEKFDQFIQGNKLPPSKSLVYAKVWRIRLSKEAKSSIFTSSLLPSTIVDSIEIDQKLSPIKMSAHVELNVSNIELKLNTKNTIELIVINLSDLSTRLVAHSFDKFNSISFSSYAQLAVEYCEFKFLTVRPLCEPLQFKTNIRLDQADSARYLMLDVDMDEINLIVSQSGLLALKQLQYEWIETELKSKNNKSPPYYFLIHNDTGMSINIKQHDTEETCLIAPGKKMSYSWRTNKKPQLIQMFVKQYRIVSQPFQIGKNGVQEVEFFYMHAPRKSIDTIENNVSCPLKCLINVETRFLPGQSAFRVKGGQTFKKYVLIQSKLLICNYLNIPVDSLFISYTFINTTYEITAAVDKLSRSTTSLEIFTTSMQPQIEINSIQVNGTVLSCKSSLFNVIKSDGLLCTDRNTGIKYWLNWAEQTFTNNIVQFNLVISEMFVLCSYLPYDLNVQFNTEKKYSIKSKSVSFLPVEAHANNELLIKFDRMCKNNKKADDSMNRHPPTGRVEYLQSVEEEEASDIESMWKADKFNISLCESDENRRLVYANLFEFWDEFESARKRNSDNDVKLRISTASNNNTPEKQTTPALPANPTSKLNLFNFINSIDLSNIEGSVPNLQLKSLSSKFQIEQKPCWPFSNTTRINVKPICLLVNKTKHRIRLVENEAFDSMSTDLSSESSESNFENSVYEIDSINGQLCLSDINPNKKYKLVILNDEYLFDNISNLNDRMTKTSIEYESDWFMIKDEPISPFYRQKNNLRLNCLFLINKCWIDLKLLPRRPSNSNSQSMNKEFYFVLSNDIQEEDRLITPSDAATGQPDIVPKPNCLNYKVLTIKSKFLIRNDTKHEFKFKVLNEFMRQNEINKLMARFIQSDEYCVKPGETSYQVDEIVNKNAFYFFPGKKDSPTDQDQLISSIKKQREDMNDLFYLSLESMSINAGSHRLSSIRQSKPLILTCNEKALKQISMHTQSNENLLTSRQCFTIYNQEGSSMNYILTQKLLTEQSTGQLIICLNEDNNSLVNITNTLGVDLYVWPRISSNFIFENYVRNLKTTNDKSLGELIKDEGDSKKMKAYSDLIRQDSMLFDVDQAMNYMHFLPAQHVLKFNYDFVGTNQYPIENLNEQIFFMFAVVNNKKLANKLEHGVVSSNNYEMSQTLCKIFEKNLLVEFYSSSKCFLKFNYSSCDIESDDNTPAKLTANRILRDPDTKVERDTNSFYSKTDLTLKLRADKISIALNDDNLLSMFNQVEILRLTVDSIDVKFKKYLTNASEWLYISRIRCSCLQLDNQMFANESCFDSSEQSNGGQQQTLVLKYDFPVVFVPRVIEKSSLKSYKFTKTIDQIRKSPSVNNFLDISLVLAEQEPAHGRTNIVPVNIDVSIKPFDVYLEDYLLYNSIQIFIDYFDHITDDKNIQTQKELTNDDDLNQLVRPLFIINHFRINSIDSLVNLQTKLKIYLATYRMPIRVEKFELNGMPFLLLTSKHFLKSFTNHYLTSLIFRVGWMLGSLDLIGSPTVFIQQVSNGLYDFLFMPYTGLRASGANGLLSGLSNGSLSLLRNLSSGTITSLTSFASFVSRNMDILSFDTNHLMRQDQLRHQILSPGSDTTGSNVILNVSSSFIITIMGAIGGLAEQPIQSIYNSESLIKGFSKGLIGLVTKPVGAVAELVHQTGQGLLKYTGMNDQGIEMRIKRRPINKEFARFSISITKCLWKLIAAPVHFDMTSHSPSVLVMIEAVGYSSSSNKYSLASYKSNELQGCYLILNDDILYVVDKQEDMLLRAFYVSEIDMKITSSNEVGSSILSITINQPKSEIPEDNEYEKIYENTIDRLVDYVLHSSDQSKNQNMNIIMNNEETHASFDYFKRVNRLQAHEHSIPCTCGSKIKSLRSIKIINSVENMNEAIESVGVEASTTVAAVIKPGHVRQGSNLSEVAKIHRASADIDPTSIPQQQTGTKKQFFYYVDPRLSENFIHIFKSLKRKSSNRGFNF